MPSDTPVLAPAPLAVTPVVLVVNPAKVPATAAAEG